MKLKIPYFGQEKNTSCGIACVRMVAAFYGKNTSELELEDACETSWLGNTCGGLEGFGHFVVVTGVEDDKIYYHDPDLDKDLTRNISDFMKAWKKFSFKGVRIWKSLKR